MVEAETLDNIKRTISFQHIDYLNLNKGDDWKGKLYYN